MYTPATEGVNHINAYSKSTTELGRMLSNFERSPFKCEDGHFQSIEGYWYWLIAPTDNPKREQLRKLHGFMAKKLGREICDGDWRDDDEFKRKIKCALWFKVMWNERLKKLLIDNKLPIVHYYCYGDNPPKVITPKHGGWIWEAFSVIKKQIIKRNL